MKKHNPSPTAATVFVIVSGGIAYAVNEQGKSLPLVPVIDLDSLDTGTCPVCGEDIVGTYTKCPTCRLPLDAPTFSQVVRAFQRAVGD